jgi:hypothetical protein
LARAGAAVTHATHDSDDNTHDEAVIADTDEVVV